jgi:5-amino-6-(5-phosphoribosylamino)uracil reductase
VTPPARPYVLLSCAVSLDGYLDDATGTRLLLSDDADFDRVDELRAGCDAILVGAETVRRDNPRLAVRSATRRAARTAAGRPEHPLRVILTATGDLRPDRRIFTAPTLIYTTPGTTTHPTAPLATTVTVPPAPADPAAKPGRLDLVAVLADLADRGVARLMVEGGGRVNTAFLTAGLVDELFLAVAPFFVGDPAAPRFVGPGTFPADPTHRMDLLEARPVGDMALLHYRPRR